MIRLIKGRCRTNLLILNLLKNILGILQSCQLCGIRSSENWDFSNAAAKIDGFTRKRSVSQAEPNIVISPEKKSRIAHNFLGLGFLTNVSQK